MSNNSFVLVVEDSDAIRESLVELLRWEGFQVLSARNGLEALKLLPLINGPFAVLLDHDMPQMNGLEFIRRISEQGWAERAPIIMISANPDPSLPGIKATVPKPIDIDILLATLRTIFKE